jgi:hypothetical protein
MLVVATYTHRRKTSLAAKYFAWCPDSKKISCALLYLFICATLKDTAVVQTI